MAGSAELQGAYVGVSASVSAGRGLGADVLVGGDRNAVSVEVNQGFNIAAGVSELLLRRVPPTRSFHGLGPHPYLVGVGGEGPCSIRP